MDVVGVGRRGVIGATKDREEKIERLSRRESPQGGGELAAHGGRVVVSGHDQKSREDGGRHRAVIAREPDAPRPDIGRIVPQ